MNVRAAWLMSPLVLLLLLSGCTGGHNSANRPGVPIHNSVSSGPESLPTCPGAGGDYAVMSPTFISPMEAKLRGRITVLATTTPAHATTVHAVVTTFPNTHPEIASLVNSRIVLTRQIFEEVPAARGIVNPLIDDPAHMLWPANVVATSQVVRTADINDHELTLVVPRGLKPRDYFVVGTQRATQECTPKRTGSSQSLLGLVRVLTLDGHVATLKRLPARAR